MLLINGKPVDDDFFHKLAAVQKKDIAEFQLKKPATFKLQDSFFTTKNQREMKSGKMTTRILVSPEFSIDATYDWYNPMTGMTAKLTYTSIYTPDERGYNKNPISQVSFEYGFITVDVHQTDLKFWLNGHPLNQTNPKYLDNESTRPPKPFLFRELLPDRENNALIDHEKLVASVTLMLTDSNYKGYINNESIKLLAKAYGIGSLADKGRKDIEKFLLKFVKQDPQKVLDDMRSSSIEIRSVLADAIEYGVIKHDAPHFKWTELKGKRVVNNGIICSVAVGQEPIDYFVNFMREQDNSGVYQQIKKDLEAKKIAEAEAVTA